MQFWYRFLYYLLRFAMFFWHPVLHVYGRENIPDGGAVIASNHSSGSDPVWILLALNYPTMIRIMAKEELRHFPVLGEIMQAFRIIFVKRAQHDVAAYKECETALQNEEKLLIFIEGTRCSHGKHVRAKSGAVRLAQQTQKPIVPLYVQRKKKLFGSVSVYFGEPVFIDRSDNCSKAALLSTANEILYQIYRMGGDDYADYIGEHSGLLLRS